MPSSGGTCRGNIGHVAEIEADANAGYTCDVCGRAEDVEDLPAGWVGVEVFRGGDNHMYDCFLFCSEEHLRDRLNEPLPPVRVVEPFVMSRADQLRGVAFATLVGLAVTLFVIGGIGGIVTLIRWLT